MKLLRNMRIKRKVTVVILLISGAAMLLTGGGLFVFQLVTFRQGFTRDLSALGEIIASHSAAPLAFKDRRAANAMLEALKVKPHITHAELRLQDGTPFAHYGADEKWDPPQGDGVRFEGDYLIYSKPVILEGEEIGVLHLRSDYQKEFRSLLQLYAGILALVLTVSVLLTVVLSSRLQHVISEPILSLAKAAKGVAARKDYTVRAEKLEEDEIGEFTDAFNDMLEQIQGRDTALRLSHQKFETLVNSIEGVVWEANPETFDFLFVSKQAERLLGFPLAEWQKPSFWLERIYEEDRERTLDLSRQGVADAKPCSLEYRMRSADETLLWIRSYSTVVVEDAKPVLLRGVFLDVTREKLAAEELATLHRELIQTSRQAGMAEIATGVLHNVGNVLNSVNVSSTLVCERIRNSELKMLGRLSRLLREREADLDSFLTRDPQGRGVPALIHTLAEQLEMERTRTLKEVELLAKNIEHIKEIVTMQQNYAKVAGIVESLSASDLLEDALQINQAGFQRHKVEVVRQFEPVPLVSVDKHKVLQILINLLRNAKHAMEEIDVEKKRLVLSIARNGNDMVRIAVQDNGVGIARENLTRIFAHGFTTKKEGHGFGLHSGALAAKEMGGSLSARSDGRECGATFTLELPISKHQTT